MIEDWNNFSYAYSSLSTQLDHIKASFLFSFVEGTLIKAIKNGDWVLLDEINLASSETLESLSGLLQSSDGSILLLERGDTVPVKRHPEFRLFACMNPANDAGKRDLPPGIRSRFTEVWVDSPDIIHSDLLLIIRRYLVDYLPPPAHGGDAIVSDVASFHSSARIASESGKLIDSAGHRAHVSVRTLTRALEYAITAAPSFGLRRALFEGCKMTYLTMLGRDSANFMDTLINNLLNGVKNKSSFVNFIPKSPYANDDEHDSINSTHVPFSSFWIKKGPLPIDPVSNYIITPSVAANLSGLARAIMSEKYPILIQGPTSAGKTSIIEYMAKKTGHRFVRVNNHEHTDLQEYIGSYSSGTDGRLVFREVNILIKMELFCSISF